MSQTDELKKTIADAIRKTGFSTIMANKIYTSEELAKEVENETEIGKKIIEMAIRGTIERYKRSGK
jgi:23S rRNA pseudoU1915 N3-methylase RlmH